MKSTKSKLPSSSRKPKTFKTIRFLPIYFTWNSTPKMHVVPLPCSMSLWMHSRSIHTSYKKTLTFTSFMNKQKEKHLSKLDTFSKKTKISKKITKILSRKGKLKFNKRLKRISLHLLKRTDFCMRWMGLKSNQSTMDKRPKIVW